jgi:hypothetical protein
VSKVSAFQVSGMRCVFRANDHHPPHFHVIKPGRWEIRVNFLATTDQELDYNFKYPRNPGKGEGSSKEEIRELREKVVKYRKLLGKEWRCKVNIGEDIEL